MVVCVACGAENPEGARFCTACAAPIEVPVVPREQRKTVTVLFCDVVGSTALGESLDPEAVRALLGRYFERMRSIVERHGGTVEKFVGDAVMAVFGVPVVHEDDAMRALRAALEMVAALPELGVEARIGVSTGEVMSVSEEWLVTGDAVNVAARLQQVAGSGEILLGAETLALVRDSATVDELPPLELKGKRSPVAAYRLRAVHDVPERRHDALFVGRAEELAFLRQAWTRAVDGERCELVTITGEAGVGKSRLVAELVTSLQARVVRGRCLPYGEGITYWPVVEVIKQLDILPNDRDAAAAIRSLLGESDAATSPEEIAWAFRKLLEQSAPLLVVFDDIQWGEQTFLDLIEQVALLSTGAPLLLLCVARPELGEQRPQWPVSLRLEPLPRAEVEELFHAGVSAGLRERIARAAGGNPLFVTEMVAMAADADDDDVIVPPTLKALLAARLDQLEAPERSVLEHGSVEGELFHRGAVQALASSDAHVTPRLAALVRKELIRPDRPMIPAEDGFRFCHLLIRDAAYTALPKATRADLHERFADWLDGHGVDLVERDELVGYHLEQAHRYHTELGDPGDRIRSLGERAAGRFAAAGYRAATRSDFVAVESLVERALVLGIADPRERVRIEFELGLAYAVTRRSAEADALLGEVAEVADRLGERGVAARARVQRAWNRTGLPAFNGPEERAVAERAVETLTDVGDDRGLVLAHRLLAITSQGPAAGAALERALAHAERCGDREMRRGALNTLLNGYLCPGSTPAAEAIARCGELLQSVSGDRLLEATVKRPLALFHAMEARPDEALELIRESSLVLDELTLRNMQVYRHHVAYARELAGDRPGAVQELENMWLYFRNLRGGAIDTRAVTAALGLARMYCDEGRWEEAAEFVSYGRDAWEGNTHPRSIGRLVIEGRLKAHDGSTAEATVLLEQAIAAVEAHQPYGLTGRAQCWQAYAEVQRAAGKPADAALSTAIELYEQKGNIAAAASLRRAAHA